MTVTQTSNPAVTPRTVVCGVDGSRGSAEAVRQAVVLATGASHIDFALVEWTTGTAGTTQAAVSAGRGAAALADAAHVAHEAGAAGTTRMVRDDDPAAALVELARDADLLVVGTSPHTRVGGIVLGRVATAAAHRAPCDVLIARPAPGTRAFPQDVLIGFDGSEAAWRAAKIAADIARRHDSRVTIAYFGPSSAETRQALAEVVAEITELTGHEPVVVTGDGPAHKHLADLATGLGTSLVVLGSRRVKGLGALGSVSERVAHAVPCSVLIARGRAER